MLKWQKNFYIGEGIKNPGKIQKRLNAGKLVPGIYLLTLSDNPGNLLEILPAVTLVQNAVYTRCPSVIGIARGKDEAVALAVDILTELYDRTGAFSLEEYLKNR